jgi:predicted amidophosphoribosyltransferase
MSDTSDAENFKDGDVCIWCDAHFQPDAPQKTPVCPRCYRLLSSAGLKDEEIFAGGKRDEGEKDG